MIYIVLLTFLNIFGGCYKPGLMYMNETHGINNEKIMIRRKWCTNNLENVNDVVWSHGAKRKRRGVEKEATTFMVIV